MPASTRRGEGLALGRGMRSSSARVGFAAVGQGNSPVCSTRRPYCQPFHSQAINACDPPFRKCVLTLMQTPKISPKGLGSLKSIHGCHVKNPYTRSEVDKLISQEWQTAARELHVACETRFADHCTRPCV